jgi:hypothetical protein
MNNLNKQTLGIYSQVVNRQLVFQILRKAPFILQWIFLRLINPHFLFWKLTRNVGDSFTTFGKHQLTLS